jgi:hypothetical protein
MPSAPQGTVGYSGSIATGLSPEYQKAAFDYLAIATTPDITWAVRVKRQQACRQDCGLTRAVWSIHRSRRVCCAYWVSSLLS